MSLYIQPHTRWITMALNLLTWPVIALAQYPTGFQKARFIGLSGVASKVEVHSMYVKNLNNTFPTGITVNYGIHDFSDKAVETYGCNIRFGGMVQYWQFNHKALGNGLAAMAYAEPFLLARDRFMWSIRTSAGFIGLSKPYNATHNPDNQAYSTHIAFPLSLETNVYLPISYKWAVTLSGGLNHFSNGGIKKPNYGLNHTSFSLGIEHNFAHYGVPPRPYFQNLRLNDKQRHWQREIAASLALEDDGSGQDKDYLLLIDAKCYYRLTRINGVGAGLLVEDNLTASRINKSSSNLSALVGHRFYLGKFSFTQDLSLAILNGFDSNRWLYQFYAIDLALANHWLVGCNLKAHTKTADYLGLRVGYRW